VYLPTVASRRGHPHPRRDTNDTGPIQYRFRTPVCRSGDRYPPRPNPSQTDLYVTVPKLHPCPRDSELRPTTERRWGVAQGSTPTGYSRQFPSSVGSGSGPLMAQDCGARRRCVAVSAAPCCQWYSPPTNNTARAPTPMIDTRKRRSGRPSSIHRTHRIRMATDTPALPRDRIEPDSDHAHSVGGGHDE